MIRTLRRTLVNSNYGIWLIVAAVLALALSLGQRASATTLGVLVAAMAGMLLLARPWLGLPALVLTALVLPMEIATGTEVALTPVTLLLPALLGLWLLVMILRGKVALVHSPVNTPLILFVAAGLLSLLVGLVLWDPKVPRTGNFTLVQLAQWTIFALSAGVLLLTGNLVKRVGELRKLTFFFLLVGGTLAFLGLMPALGPLMTQVTTGAFTRAPFWVLLGGLAGGQLLFNQGMTLPWRLFLLAVVGTTIYYSFVVQNEAASNWVGLAVTGAVLGWLRWPRFSWLFAIFMVSLALTGLLFPTVYQFAGGDEEWVNSGESRLILTERVIDVTMRNPVLGLGPAAYRPYAAMEPLQMDSGRLWIGAVVSSHNNYVDLFSHMGLVGLAFFCWFVVKIALLGNHLRSSFRPGFESGYINAMLAVGAGSLAVMILADWILPFVYNIGFHGFQASVLVWLFLGGLIALDYVRERDNDYEGD